MISGTGSDGFVTETHIQKYINLLLRCTLSHTKKDEDITEETKNKEREKERKKKNAA